MDQCTNVNVGKKTVDELFHIAVPSDAGLPDLLPVFMKMMVAEVSFLQGYSVIESTHTSVLLWPQSWKHLQAQESSLVARLLLAYGQCSLKTLSHLFNYITTAEIYEDEDFNPAFHTLIHCELPDGDDEDVLVNRLTTLIAEVKATAAFAGQEALVLLLEYRALMHQTARALATHVTTVTSTTTAAIRLKRRVGAGDSPAPSLTYPDIAPIGSRMRALQQTLAALQANTLLQDIADRFLPTAETTVTSLTIAQFASTATDHPSFALAQSLFRSELTRLKNISPVRVIAPPTFPAALHALATVTAQFAELETVVASWPANCAVFGGVAALPWEYLLTLSLTLARRSWHLLTRSFYVTCLQTTAYHLDVSLLLTLSQRGIPTHVLLAEEARLGWLSGSLYALAWDILKALTVVRTRLFTQRWPILLQSAGNVVSEAMFVDEQVYVALEATTPPPPAAGLSTAPPPPPPPPNQWFTTYGAVLTSQLMDVYLQMMEELGLCGPDESDVLYWYSDYIHSTHLHALDKLRAQRLQVDIQRYEEARMQRDLRHRQIQQLQRLRDQRQAQWDLDRSLSSSSSSSSKGASKTTQKKGKKPTAAASSDQQQQQQQELKQQLDRDLAHIDRQLTQLRSDDATDRTATTLSLPEIVPMTAEDHLRRGQAQLCRGLFRAVLVYKQLGLLPDTHRDWMTKRALFARRFMAFDAVVNPAPLAFQDFLQTINQQQQQADGGQSKANKAAPKAITAAAVAAAPTPPGALVTSDERRAEEAAETTQLVDLPSVLRGAIQCFQNARKHLDEARKFSAANVLETYAQLQQAQQAQRAAGDNSAAALAQQGSVTTSPTVLAKTAGHKLATTTMDQAVALIKVSLASVLATTKVLEEVVLPRETAGTTPPPLPPARALHVNTSYHPHFIVLDLVPLPPSDAAAVAAKK